MHRAIILREKERESFGVEAMGNYCICALCDFKL